MIKIGAIKIENRDKMWEYFLKNKFFFSVQFGPEGRKEERGRLKE
jgi:hypothetical protein